MPVTLDKSSARIRQMFGQIARRYDLLNHLLSLGIDRRWRRRAVELVPPGSEAKWVLDVCTGTADLALAYCAGSGQEVRIVGADFCRPMLAVGRRKCRHAGAAGRVALVEADALRLPFRRRSLRHRVRGLRTAQPERHRRGLARNGSRLPARRAGGRAGVLHAGRRPLGVCYGWYFRRVLPRVGQALARNRQEAYNYLPASVGQFPQGEALAERMRAAGLDEVQCRPFTLGVCTLYTGRKTL